jgi:hypothetical protein
MTKEVTKAKSGENPESKDTDIKVSEIILEEEKAGTN